MFRVSKILLNYLFWYFYPQFDEPTEDLPEFVAEEEAGFKGESCSHGFFFSIKNLTVTDCPLKRVF